VNRLKKAWRVLWGEDLGSGGPYRFVQLLNYQDNLIGLAGNGDLYAITVGYRGYDVSVSLLMVNPVRP